MPQRLYNCRLFSRRALRLFSILGFWLVVILALNDAVLPLHLRNVQVADIQSAVLEYIILDLMIGGLALRRCQIQLAHVQIDLDIMLGVKFGQ